MSNDSKFSSQKIFNFGVFGNRVVQYAIATAAVQYYNCSKIQVQQLRQKSEHSRWTSTPNALFLLTLKQKNLSKQNGDTAASRSPTATVSPQATTVQESRRM